MKKKYYTRGSQGYNKKNVRAIKRRHAKKVLRQIILFILKLGLIIALAYWTYIILKNRL